jgi:hypothetical protein
MSLEESQGLESREMSRRSLVKGAAWALPVIAVVAAAPMASASTVDVGAFTVNGSCGLLGTVNPGFSVTAGPTTALPAGTIITITGSGVANIGVFSVFGGTASVTVLSDTSREVTLTSALPAGATLSLATTLSVSLNFTLNAVATLPTGYTATGAKTSGSVSATLIFCDAS